MPSRCSGWAPATVPHACSCCCIFPLLQAPVCLIDTGISLSHPDLPTRALGGRLLLQMTVLACPGTLVLLLMPSYKTDLPCTNAPDPSTAAAHKCWNTVPIVDPATGATLGFPAPGSAAAADCEDGWVVAVEGGGLACMGWARVRRHMRG